MKEKVKELTLHEIIQEKLRTEQAILSWIREFEEKTGIVVDHIVYYGGQFIKRDEDGWLKKYDFTNDFLEIKVRL